MSLARQFFREMRPLFRMLEEPVGRSPAYLGSQSPIFRSLLDDPFFHSPGAIRPAVDVTEEGDKYIVEAELPGVKKEDVEVRIADGGRSLTIEGKVLSRRTANADEKPAEGTSSQTTSASTSSPSGEGSQAVTTTSPQQNQISTERAFTGSATFTRTVWLPRPVDSNNVNAKLDHGVLTVTIPKAQDPESVSIPVH